MKKAMEISPRGQRAQELLKVTAGSQSISPFYWAIDSGALACAEAILQDLLTIRADRDVFRHRNTRGMLEIASEIDSMSRCITMDATASSCTIPAWCDGSVTAPTLLPTLMDGLVWRSRQTREGWRRVNFYVKHLLQDADGDVSQNLEWLVKHSDPVIIRHPTVVLFADLLWRLASYQFMASKLYFLLTLCAS